MEVSKWIEDLDYLAKKIFEIHPNPFHENKKNEWDRILKQSQEKIAKGDKYTSIAELYRVVALLADAHSRIELQFSNDHSDMQSTLTENFYGFHSYVFDNGIFVTKASDNSILGKKLVSINGTLITDLAQKMVPFIPAENEYGVAAMFPLFVKQPLFLKACQIIENIDQPIVLEFDDER